MRAASSNLPLAGNLAWWLTAFILIVLSLAVAIAGGALLGEWFNSAADSVIAVGAAQP
jgi:hypothetical protein